MAGTNDLNAGNTQDPISSAPGRLGSLIDQIVKACPDAVVVVAKLVPNTGSGKPALVATFNAAVSGLVQTRQAAGAKVILADMFSAVDPSQLGDRLHPNDNGYTGMAAEWYRVIAEAAGR